MQIALKLMTLLYRGQANCGKRLGASSISNRKYGSFLLTTRRSVVATGRLCPTRRSRCWKSCRPPPEIVYLRSAQRCRLESPLVTHVGGSHMVRSASAETATKMCAVFPGRRPL